MKQALQSVVVSLASYAPLARVLGQVAGARAAIFMMHRFRHPERGHHAGHDPEAVRRDLEFLRANGYRVMPVADIVRAVREGATRTLRRAVAFTLDDGYVDQAEIAAPLFAEYDCPATTFVTTGFVDGRVWMWWDKLEYALLRTKADEVDVTIGGVRFRDSWGSRNERLRSRARIAERMKASLSVDLHDAAASIAHHLGVELPEAAPGEYRAMSPAELATAEKFGMRFGPHTVTHPLLASLDDAHVEREIEGSWARVRELAARPVPVFCYPNGTGIDYGAREMGIIERLGFDGALAATPGAVCDDHARGIARFGLPRYAYSETTSGLVQQVSGIERIKARLRGIEPAPRIAAPAPAANGNGNGKEHGPAPRILFITYHFPPAMAVGAFRAGYFARACLERGIDVRVIAAELGGATPDPTLARLFPEQDRVTRVAENPLWGDRYLKLRDRLRRTHDGTGPGVVEPGKTWTDTRGRDGSRRSLKKFLLDLDNSPDEHRGWMRPALRAADDVLREFPADNVFVSGPPWSGVWAAYRFARRHGLRLILDYRDPWTEVSGAGEELGDGARARLARRMERQVVEFAEHLTFNAGATMDAFVANYDGVFGADVPVHLIPNGSLLAANQERRPLPAEGPYRLRHLGALYADRTAAFLIEALKGLDARGRLPEAGLTLELVGGSPTDQPSTTRHGRLTVEVTPRVGLSDAVRVMNEPGVLVLLSPAQFNRQVPTKVYDYLRTGNPVLALCPEESATWEIARDYPRSRRADFEDVAAIAECVAGLLDDWRAGRLAQQPAGDSEPLSAGASASSFGELMRAFTTHAPDFDS